MNSEYNFKMDSEMKFWVIIVAIISLAIVTIIGISCIYDYKFDTKMAELGFQKTMVIGNNRGYYQKVPDEVLPQGGTIIKDSTFTGTETGIKIEPKENK